MPVIKNPDQVIAFAKGEIGYHEGRSDGHWNNREKYAAMVGQNWVSDQAQPWCDIFVWACADAGGAAREDWPRSASCDVSGAAFKQMGRWSEYPAVGAQVFFGTPTDLNHTGLVVAYDDTFVWTIEGNTNDSGAREGDGVYAKQHRRDEPRIVGYGYPLYADGIDSADPAWAHQKPAKPPVLVHPAPLVQVPWKRPAWPKPRWREVLAYANVFDGLSHADAKIAFDEVRASEAQLVGLGEWGPGRQDILDADEAFTWVKPGPACPPVGADKARYVSVTAHMRLIAKGRAVDRKPNGQPSRTHLGDLYATVSVWQERPTGDLVTVVNAHLPSASSKAGIWRRIAGALSPRARMAREAKREVRAIVKRHWAFGRRVYVVGDMNIHNMQLRPLVSCWEGRTLRPTLNRSTYDMVLAQQPAADVRLIKTPSDHKAVVATYPKGK
jgi:hypothetical protein